MTFDFTKLNEELRFGARELAAEYGVEEGAGTIVSHRQSDRLSVHREGDTVTIGASTKSEFFRGLIKAFAGETCEQRSAFSHLTLMADCSRDAVLSVPAVKKLVRLLAACGYDRLQLYTEDTYKIENRPRFGYLRGAYTEAELRDLDAYGQALGVTLVPCIQTLAHLNAIFRWGEFADLRDCNDILLCDDERVYELIDDMFAQLSRSFTARVAHIGMDEAHMVGLGKYLDGHGYQNRFDIIHRHLTRVLQIAEKYGFTCYMWGDMFFRLAFGGEYYRFDREIPQEVIDSIPKNVNLVYWDYYQTDRKVYDGMIESYRKIGNPMSFAGGAWRWSGFMPQNRFSLNASRLALDSCIGHGVDDIAVTAWGDNGGEASIFSVLPSVVYFAERRYGGDVKTSFRNIVGCDFEDFLALDLPDAVYKDLPEGYLANSSKIFLYNDLFLGIFDGAAKPEYKRVFRANLKKISAARSRAGKFAYLFDTAYTLLDAVLEKYDFGARLIAAYGANDRETLAALVKDLGRIEKKVRVFYKAFSAQWYRENKPNGMEVHDARLGGLLGRILACKARLTGYLSGDISALEELEEERLGGYERTKGLMYNNWAELISANIV